MRPFLRTMALLAIPLVIPTTMASAQDLSNDYRNRQRADALATQSSSDRPEARYFAPQALHANPFNKLGMADTHSSGLGNVWVKPSPEMVKSNNRVNELINQLKASEDTAAKEKLKSSLKSALEEQYDLYLAQHEEPLKGLEEKIAKLRKEFEWRKNARDDLVKLRLDTIWYNAQGLGWPVRDRGRFPLPAAVSPGPPDANYIPPPSEPALRSADSPNYSGR
jgi:hypothetical protein